MEWLFAIAVLILLVFHPGFRKFVIMSSALALIVGAVIGFWPQPSKPAWTPPPGDEVPAWDLPEVSK